MYSAFMFNAQEGLQMSIITGLDQDTDLHDDATPITAEVNQGNSTFETSGAERSSGIAEGGGESTTGVQTSNDLGDDNQSLMVPNMADTIPQTEGGTAPVSTTGMTTNSRPTSTVEPAYSTYRARSLPNPNDVYADALRNARSQARQENEQLETQRREELMTVTNEYQEELKRKAAEYAAFCVTTDQNLSKNKHNSQLQHLRDKLNTLRNTDVTQLAPPDILLSAVAPENVKHTTRGRTSSGHAATGPPPNVNPSPRMPQPQVPRFPASGPVRPPIFQQRQQMTAAHTMATVPGGQQMLQGIQSTASHDESDVRRSPRAHPSSRSFDAQIRQGQFGESRGEDSVISTVIADLQSACANVSSVPQTQTMGPSAQHGSVQNFMKRRSDEGSSQSDDVLDAIFTPKRQRSAPHGIPMIPKQPSDLKTVAAQKIEKAKQLDAILSEDLKLENKSKIKQYLDMHAVDVKPNPNPTPQDTFCYNCSLLLDATATTDPGLRAANMRKMVINFVATNLAEFSEVCIHCYIQTL